VFEVGDHLLEYVDLARIAELVLVFLEVPLLDRLERGERRLEVLQAD
jgi:hypothetical protein